jgi:GAF domain-containing protein
VSRPCWDLPRSLGRAAGAATLGAFLDATIARGYLRVTLDLGAVDILEPAATGAIVAARRLLASLGGSLVLRSVPTELRRALETGGLETGGLATPAGGVQSDLERFLGPEQPHRVPPAGVVITANGGHLTRQRVTFVPSGDDLVDSVLRLVVGLARGTVGGADGVSVSLRRHGRLATVAATDRTVSDMDADQYATGEGPCVDASLQGRWFHTGALESEARWPAFTPRARALGIKAILSSPLLAGDRAVGALNIYSRTAGAFTPKDQHLAAFFAESTSNVLDDAGADVTDDRVANRLHEVLRARRTIAQAEGVLMERGRIDELTAYALLRHQSVESGRPLRDRAEDVVSSTEQDRSEPRRRRRHRRRQ